MGEKIFDEHWMGRNSVHSCTFSICECIDTKFGTEIELCIFYPIAKELVLLIYANVFMTSLVCSRALKGIEIQTTVNSPFSIKLQFAN